MPTPVEFRPVFQVNVGTADNPLAREPEITGLSDGRFLITWVETGTNGVATASGTDIVGQFYTSSGFSDGPAFALDTSATAGDQDDFEVVATNDGGFLITYRTDVTSSGVEVFVEKYDASAVRVNNFELLPSSNNNLTGPQIAFNLTDGASFLSYVSENPDFFGTEALFGVTFNASLTQGPFELLNDNDVFTNQNPSSIAYNVNSEIVATYLDDGDLRVDIYSETGVFQDFVEVAEDLSPNATPRVVTLDNGNIVVSWSALFGSSSTDFDVRFRVYDSDLNPISVVQNAASSGGVEDRAALIALPQGGFFIAWDDQTAGALRGRAYTNTGAPDGSTVTLVDGPIEEIELGVTIDGRILFTYQNAGNVFAGIADPRGDTVNTGDYLSSSTRPNFVSGNEFHGPQQGGTILGTTNSETIFAGNGDTTINGGGGFDSIRGGVGNDVITVNPGDTVSGGSGADTFVVQRSDVLPSSPNVGLERVDIDGGSNVNVLNLTLFMADVDLNLSNDEFLSSDGNGDIEDIDVVLSGSGNDRLVGDGFAQQLDGGSGNDTILSGFGNDTLIGGIGNDLFTFSGGQNIDEVHGGSDTDTLDLSGLTGTADDDLVIDLNLNQWSVGGILPLAITGIENIIGSQNSDEITGADSVNHNFDGQDGNDTLFGASGNDTIIGGLGDDSIGGGAGNDSIDGGAGSDTIDGGNGSDLLEGGVGDDVLRDDFGVSDDTLNGGDGNDTLFANFGSDSFDGGADNDTYQIAGSRVDSETIHFDINLSDGTDTFGNTYANIENVNAGQGNDTITGDSELNVINGGAGDDLLEGGDGDDTIDGGRGDDSIEGGDGDDVLRDDLGSGADTLNGGVGNDTLFANFGSDTLDGGADTDTFQIAGSVADVGGNIFNFDIDLSAGTDTFGNTYANIENVNAGQGNDAITGDGKVNVIDGGAGDDTIRGGIGDDTISGGDGDDLFIDNLEDGTTEINGDGDLDTLDLSGASAGVTGNRNQITSTSTGAVVDLSSVEGLIGTDFADDINEEGFYGISLGGGDDTLTGSITSSIKNSFNGGIGNDTFIDEGTSDLVLDLEAENGVENGGTKNIDLIDFENITAGSGRDSIFGTNADGNILLGMDGSDTILGLDGDDTLDGGAGTDQLFGGANDDALSGGDDEDTLEGGAGRDVLTGGAGSDVLTGGTGADTFVLEIGMGDDVVTDFIVGEDMLGFSSLSNAEASAVTFSANSAGDRVVNLSDGSTLTLTGVARNTAPTGAPTISGTATEGEALTVDTSSIQDADGLSDFSIQWLRNGTAVDDETSSSYTLTQADVGAAISAQVSYTDGFGTDESVTSAATGSVQNVNDAPTGQVSVSGVVQQGQVLTANASSVQDTDGLGSLSFQWLRDGSLISEATDASYTLTQADVDATISTQVSYTDGFGTDESVTSAATSTVSNENDAPTGQVSLSGVVQQGQVLTANASTVQDTDGLGSLSFQWLRDGSPISEATDASYTLTQADVGAAISAQVSYTDGFGTEESVTSAATSTVSNENDAPTGQVSLSGVVQQGQVLTANASTVQDTDGLGSLSFQWLRDGSLISEATDASYTLTQADVGAAISAQVSYTDGFGTEESVTSAATGSVQNVNDVPTGQVIITGTQEVGGTLTADSDNIDDLDAIVDSSVAFQWLRNGSGISGANAETYLLTQDDTGAVITVEVNYVDGGGTSERLLSAATGSISGDVGLTLIGTPGVDRLQGASQGDVLTGLAGNDTLVGGGGNDTLNGDDGTDILNGGAGDDFIVGGTSTNDLRDVVFGGDGNDLIDGGYGNDELRGDAGNDTILGGFGADTVIGGSGDDTLTGSALGDLLFGADGDDFINGGFGFDRVNGGAGADEFFHLGVEGHGTDFIQDYAAAEGDVLVFGNANATRNQFQINVTTTPTAGLDDVEEAFVIYRPTGQIIWALVDGDGQDEINLRIGGDVFDLLA